MRWTPRGDRIHGDTSTSVLTRTVGAVNILFDDLRVVVPHDARHRILGGAQEFREVGSNDRKPRRILFDLAACFVVRLGSWHPELDHECEWWLHEFTA